MDELAHETVCNCLAVRQAARQITQLYDDELSGTGLRSTQYTVLARLARIQPATMQELADALAMDRTTLTHNLKPLEREGWVSIGVRGDDRRTRRLQLTATGTTTLEAARPAWKKAQRRFEKAFGESESEELRRLLNRVVKTTR